MGENSIELVIGARRPAALRLLSDDRLARRAALGDRGAFAVIFERHHQGLYRYCRSILHQEEDARDALQATFPRAIAALDGESRQIAIRPWLHRIAHNEAISLARRRRPQVDLESCGDLPSRDADVDKQFSDYEQLRRLLWDLREIAERQRSALLLRELNDLSYNEISQALEITEHAARQSVYEARVMLLELRQGREMDCDAVRALISARDGRALRPRRVRAHLRSCENCDQFRVSISSRRNEFGAMAPLPAAVAAALLQSILGGGCWGCGGLIAAPGAPPKGLTASAALGRRQQCSVQEGRPPTGPDDTGPRASRVNAVLGTQRRSGRGSPARTPPRARPPPTCCVTRAIGLSGGSAPEPC